MKAIIFGASGQDGYYLSAFLRQKGFEVIAVSRSHGFLQIDQGNYEQVSQLIKDHQPEFIFQLAANSTTNHDACIEYHESISMGTLYVLEAVFRYSKSTSVFIPGSGLQFKNEGQPIKETDPFEPGSIYAVCRIQAAYAARY